MDEKQLLINSLNMAANSIVFLQCEYMQTKDTTKKDFLFDRLRIIHDHKFKILLKLEELENGSKTVQR